MGVNDFNIPRERDPTFNGMIDMFIDSFSKAVDAEVSRQKEEEAQAETETKEVKTPKSTEIHVHVHTDANKKDKNKD